MDPPPPTTVRSPDYETETPTPVKQLRPPLLPNGVLKRHPPHVVFTYGKCGRNHTVGTGGNNLDGCCEFTPAATATPTDPSSLTCVACGCHRNFHHREAHHFHPATQNDVVQYQYHPPPPHMLVAGISPPPPENNPRNLSNPTTPLSVTGGTNPDRKKRFRSKFTQYQKAKMQEFAERIGWKMQHRFDDMIVGFCNEIGVGKSVFKVWMHNNKNICVRNSHRNHREDAGNNRQNHRLLCGNDGVNGSDINGSSSSY